MPLRTKSPYWFVRTRRYPLILMLVSTFCMAWAQETDQLPTSIADNLRREFSEATDSEKKWSALHELTRHFAVNDRDSVQWYSDQLLAFAKREIPEKIPMSLVAIGEYHIEYKAYEKATDILHEAMALADEQDCSKCKIEALNELFQIPYDRGEYEKALDLLHQSLRIARETKDSVSIARSMTNIGLVYSQVPQNDSTKAYIQRAIDIATPIKEYRILRFCHNNLGIVYENTGAYPEAIDQFKLSSQYAQLDQDREMFATTLFNIGSSFALLNKADSALYYFERSRVVMEALERDDLLAYYHGAIYEVHKKLGNHETALTAFEKATSINDSLRRAAYSRNLSEAETKFKTHETQAELFKKELALQKQHVIRNRILAGAALTLLLGLVLFQYYRNRYRLRNRETEMALQLEHAESEKLRELDELKSRFFANISHEFRTPLTLIKGPLKDLLAGTAAQHRQKYYRIMNRNADRLLLLINQLLDLSKLESGHLQLRPSKNDLTKFVRAIAFSFESMAINKQIDFQVRVPNEAIYTPFDRDKMEVILSNLLSNAFKFTQEHGQIEVLLHRPQDAMVIIEVRDTGIGIPSDELSSIFDRFYRTDRSAVGESIGSGIGLALTKELVELHGGEINVRSEVDRETVFTIRWPIKPLETPLDKPSESGDEPMEGAVLVQPVNLSQADGDITVLIVEDNDDVRAYIADHLRDQYSILEAIDGEKGWESTLSAMPDLIISDVMMPILDGVELCNRLKKDERTSHIPIILLTAKAEQSDRIEGLEAGADNYLTKPFDAAELKIRVRNLIDQRRQLQARFSKLVKLEPDQIAVTSADEAFLQKVMSTIEANMDDEDFTIEEMADAVHMSRFQLNRKIKALTDQSPSVFLRSMRLKRAMQLLQQKVGSVSEICYTVGFSSPAYFSKCFSDQFDRTPNQVLQS